MGVLEEICEGDAMHLELMAKLLDTERQYRKKPVVWVYTKA